MKLFEIKNYYYSFLVKLLIIKKKPIGLDKFFYRSKFRLNVDTTYFTHFFSLVPIKKYCFYQIISGFWNDFYFHSRELEELCQVRSKTERAIRLNALMNDHWFLEDYIEAVSDTFGPELIFTILDIYVQLLLFLYEMVWDTVIRGAFRDNQYPVYLVGSIELSIIIGKFIYLCYRCDVPIKEVIIIRVLIQ